MPKIPDSAQEEILGAYARGASALQLSVQYGVTSQTVSAYIAKRGGVLRSKYESSQLRRAVIDESQLQSLMNEAKLAQWEIAAKLGISLPVIERKLRAMGLKSQKGRGSKMERNYFWKGGRCFDADGYVLVKAPTHPFRTASGYIREHRLMMEAVLGRYLSPREVVHHRDGDKSNNDPGNLQVFESNSQHFLDEHRNILRDWNKNAAKMRRQSSLGTVQP